MRIFGYWGKAQNGHHLLPYHCLDVAACAVALLRQNRRISQTLTHLTNLNETRLLALIGWSAALHDLGKLSPSFQWKVPELARGLGQQETDCPADVRHDSLGWVLWRDRLARDLDLPPDQQDRAEMWLRCATGHHGTPPSRTVGLRTIKLNRYFPGSEHAAALEWVRFAERLFMPDLSAGDLEALRRASWWVAGLVTLADWLGSSTQWFPYQPQPGDLHDYWQATQDRARTAVIESGLDQKPTRRTFAELFPHYQPTPIQAEAARLDPDQAFLLIIEEATGGGKTEAALAAVGGDSFFFGLPTMATANGLWSRVAELQSQQTLIHSKGWLVPHAMERAEAWVNDSSRKQLLASIGVGTVDQAMLAVLLVRYGALRLIGLAGRSLIIDEVHAYDPYMTRILERLVEFHARAGGNVVLLSATMPMSIRQGFVQAWSRGRGLAAPPLASTEFPLLTYWDGQHASQKAVASYRPKEIRVERETSLDAILDRIISASRQGRCVVWIRNTVRDALEAFDALEAQGISPDLFHARFAQQDRLDIESRVLATFGKASTHEQRSGRVLVATQVVEQSLDLDFDLMVTDLAPVDLIIQRAGRLHRHERGPRGTPTLVVHCPPCSESPDSTWVSDWSSGTAFVYPDHGRLWLTLKLLGDGFVLPTDSRRLVEGVYCEAAAVAAIPGGLNENALKARHKRDAMTESARANLIPPGMDYSNDGGPIWDDEEAPTRLGERSREWVLCENGMPLCGDIEKSVVSLRYSALARAPEATGLRTGPWRKTLNFVEGVAECERMDGTRLRVRYDPRRGLSWGD